MAFFRINNLCRISGATLGKKPSIGRRYFPTAAMWIFLFLFVVVPAQWSMAEPYEELYGKELTGASYAMRYRYQGESGQSWREASYEERLAFVEQWEQERQQAKDIEAQEDLNQQTALEQKKYAKEQAKMYQQQKIEARAQAKQDRIQAEQQKKQQFDQRIQQQKQRISDMRNRQ